MKEILKNLRIESGLTQKELAQKLHTTDKNIWVYEKGNATPPLQILNGYADFFDVSVDYLLGRDTQKNLVGFENHEITDKQTLDIIKLCKVMNEIQKAQVFGYVVGLLEQAGVNVQHVLGY